MNTAESLVADAQRSLDEAIAGGRFSDGKAARQLVNAYSTLFRLRAEYELSPSDGLAAQIAFWRRQVPRDVDEPAAGADEPAAAKAAKKPKAGASPADLPLEPT